MAKVRKLIIANGRGDYGRNRDNPAFPKGFDGHMFVCAYNKADAVRLLQAAGYATMTIREFNIYWSKGCWGNCMDGITQERGVWFQKKNDSGHTEGVPTRVI